jgi:hypothetical protein
MPVLLAAYLDPRFKDLAFVQDSNARERLLHRAFEAAVHLLGHPDAMPSQQQDDGSDLEKQACREPEPAAPSSLTIRREDRARAAARGCGRIRAHDQRTARLPRQVYLRLPRGTS